MKIPAALSSGDILANLRDSFVVPNALERGVPQVTVRRPLVESDFGHDFWPNPRDLFHFLAIHPVSTTFFESPTRRHELCDLRSPCFIVSDEKVVGDFVSFA
jgi:hypothetical protein